MNIKKLFSSAKRAAGGYGGISLAMTALFIAAIVILNMIIYTLAGAFSWYGYLTPNYSHKIGGASEAFLSGVGEGETVRIRFCLRAEELDADLTHRLVHETAKQFAARHDFVEVEYINIVTSPREVAKYKYGTDPETGEQVKVNDITTESVIIDGGDDFMVQSISSFYIVNSDRTASGYNGEEVMAAMIRRVLTDEIPKAYFTNNHGESSGSAFYNLLVCAGYNPSAAIDLVNEEIPEDCGMLIIANPRYDFEEAKEGSGIRTEIERIEEYLAAGGFVYVQLDPYVTDLPHLSALLARYGMQRETAVVRDVAQSLSPDGMALITRYGTGEVARAISGRVAAAGGDAKVIMKNSAPITLGGAESGIRTEAILTSSPSASSYANGELVSDAGSFALAALAENEAGGAIFLASSLFLTSQDAIQTNGYANGDLLYALFEEAGDAVTPIGCSILRFETNRLEGLAMGTVHVWTVVLVGIIPVAVMVLGFVLTVRRKNR